MTTPSREEAPERVWMVHYDGGWSPCLEPPTFFDGPKAEYTRADLANREPSEGDVERVARAIGRESTGEDDASMSRLILHPYQASWEVPTKSRWKQWEREALAAIKAWRNP